MSVVCEHARPKPVLRKMLSVRQVQILRGLAGGLTNLELAEAAGITVGTVKVYLSRDIFPTIGVGSRHEAAMWALRNAELLAATGGDR
jgi:DNA-binding NarL/FixJ family response regulator